MLKVIQVLLLFIFISMLIGCLIMKALKEKQASFFKSILCGSIVMMALFEVLFIPMTILGQTLSRLTQIWAILVGLIALVSALVSKKLILELIKTAFLEIKKINVFDGIVLFFVVIQMVICYKYIFTHANDAYYVGMASTTLTTDQLLSYSPYTGASITWSSYKAHLIASLPAYWAMLAKIFGVTGAFMCHSIVPVLYIPLAYVLYREIGMLLFKQEHNHVSLFILMICIGNFFIGNHYDTSYEMLTTSVWQGGTFLYNIALPGIFYFEFKFLKKGQNVLDLVMAGMMFIIGVMSVPKSGIVLSSLTVILLGFSFLVERMLTKRKRIDAGINI